MMQTIKIKPLSVNECWQGRRFKTEKYKKYEKDLLLLLPNDKPPKAPYLVYIGFYFSSNLSDIDNGLKPFLDVLQKKYKINDRDIMSLTVHKFIVPKGKESVMFNISHFDEKTY